MQPWLFFLGLGIMDAVLAIALLLIGFSLAALLFASIAMGSFMAAFLMKKTAS